MARANAFGNESVTDVVALLHGAGVPGVALRLREHTAFVHDKGLAGLTKAHYAFNGKLRPFLGSGQVRCGGRALCVATSHVVLAPWRAGGTRMQPACTQSGRPQRVLHV